MAEGSSITDHYEDGGILERLEAALAGDGADPAHPTLAELAPYDQFHGRGLEATAEMADGLSVAAEDHLLDVGSGLGGPARYMADRFGCRVTGIDLTPEFCDIATELSRRLGLQDRVEFRQGDALSLPFEDASFDGAYSMNVSMNIADKARLYEGIFRVLRPGGWLVLSEIAQGPGGAPDYPTPWAATDAASFLNSVDETRAGLEAAGFTVSQLREATEAYMDFAARSRALVEQGEKPPHRAVMLVHPEFAAEAARNTNRGYAQGRLIPIEVTCVKPE